MPLTTAFIILASKSPRRRELLAKAGYRFVVHPPDDGAESGFDEVLPTDRLVRELAYRKAAAVVDRVNSGQIDPHGPAGSKQIVLGCDTVAECEGRILGKPVDRDDARRMLTILSSRRHRVISGLCLWPVDSEEPPIVDVAETTLRMDKLTEEQLEDYLDSGGWQSKAGAFGYQDRTGWVHVVEGSPSNVVGLPMELLDTMLAQLGCKS